jgi:hypothetical protein
VLIAAFVALQFAIPLTYLAREDGSDDRFTWKSLTEPEPASCETEVSLARADGQREAVALEKLVHADWLDYVQRGRRAVVDAFLKQQCEAGDVLEIELVNRCADDGEIREYSLRCGGERSHETVRTAAR